MFETVQYMAYVKGYIARPELLSLFQKCMNEGVDIIYSPSPSLLKEGPGFGPGPHIELFIFSDLLKNAAFY